MSEKLESIEMLYSTYGDGIYSLLENMPDYSDNVYILIVHQVTTSCSPESVKAMLHNRSDVRYYPSNTIGVAVSRNVAIANSIGDIILFCDDDVVYDKEFPQIIFNAYRENPSFDGITFSIKELGTDNLTKRFKNYTHLHNLFSILKVGTIEVTVKRSIAVKHQFPENLGAGSTLPLCDEPVFLSRLIKSAAVIGFVPNSFASHPKESSGRLIDSINKLKSRLVAFRYIYGNKFGSIFFVLFSLKNCKKIKNLNWIIGSFRN